MTELLKTFFSPFIVIYVIGVAIVPVIVPTITRLWRKRIAARRKSEGLDDRILRDLQVELGQQRRHALLELSLFVFLVLLLPLVIISIIRVLEYSAPEFLERIIAPDSSAEQEVAKINLAFAALLVWTLVSGTPLAKNFLGGLGFRAVSALTRSIQIGDRATLAGHHGIVREIGNFYTKLQTSDDDLVSVPSASLLGSAISSANAGSRSSLCVIPFYITPHSSPDECQKAEDVIWETIQSSVYYDFARPIKILLSQTETSIVMLAKVYVASTYDAPEFAAEVTKNVLRAFSENGITITALDRGRRP